MQNASMWPFHDARGLISIVVTRSSLASQPRHSLSRTTKSGLRPPRPRVRLHRCRNHQLIAMLSGLPAIPAYKTVTTDTTRPWRIARAVG